MQDILAALNAALLPLSAGYLYNFIFYQYSRRGIDQTTALSIFSWSMLCISIGIFMSSSLYFLHDFDLIFRSVQQKLSILPRSFFVVALLLAYQSLEFPWRRTIACLSVTFMIAVFVARVLL